MCVCVWVCLCERVRVQNVCWKKKKEMQDASSDSVPRGQTRAHTHRRRTGAGAVAG